MSNTVQIGLRVRPQMRQRLYQEARKNCVSVNAEISRRLQESLEAGAARSVEIVATELTTAWANWKDQERAIRQACETWAGKRGKAASGA
jgi:hypothetical protein